MVLPKSMRLKGYKCFDHLHFSGIKFRGQSMMLRVSKANPHLLKYPMQLNRGSFKCAVSISKKVSKKAVIRNKIRRLLHNHLRNRLHNSSQIEGKWALISLRPEPLKKHPENLLLECDQLLFKAGLHS